MRQRPNTPPEPRVIAIAAVKSQPKVQEIVLWALSITALLFMVLH